eukprot:m.208546 g.208546  ORF g.208546 m.208546 type:complete len:66 (+) comp33010_c0_seq2:267-464(+)
MFCVGDGMWNKTPKSGHIVQTSHSHEGHPNEKCPTKCYKNVSGCAQARDTYTVIIAHIYRCPPPY